MVVVVPTARLLLWAEALLLERQEVLEVKVQPGQAAVQGGQQGIMAAQEQQAMAMAAAVDSGALQRPQTAALVRLTINLMGQVSAQEVAAVAAVERAARLHTAAAQAVHTVAVVVALAPALVQTVLSAPAAKASSLLPTRLVRPRILRP